MWLERFGLVDENIFFGFCAVVFVVIVVVAVVVVARLCSSVTAVPGHSLTFFTLMSSLLVCTSVLFRGVQPVWATSPDALQYLCQLFIPMLVLGYTLFASSMFIRVWMLLLALRWEKNTVEWLGHFVLWIILMVAAVLVIIWEYSFPPFTHPSADVDNFTTSAVYECRGWKPDGSSDIDQFSWRIAMSFYLAVFLLLAITALPFYLCIPMYDRQPRLVKLNVVSVLVVTINSLLCVVVGLVVWYQYNPTSPSVNDSHKYAIVGSLQLWMMLVAVAAILLTELVALRMRSPSTVSMIQKRSISSTYSANKREVSSKGMLVDAAPDTEQRYVTNDVTDDVTEDPYRPVSLVAVDYDSIRRRPSQMYANSQESAEDCDVVELMEDVDVDSGHGTVAMSVDHGADTTRSSYRTSTIDEDVSTLY